MDKLSIGQMAKLNNVSVQALRLYDEMGLLVPMMVNEETGYRYYDVKQSAQLDMIQYMKATGMSLKEIQQIFENHDLEMMNQILHRHLLSVEQKIHELHLQKRAVKRMIDSYNRYLASPPDHTITLEYIEERKMYASSTEFNFYDYDIEMYENILKQLKGSMKRRGIAEIYYYNAGTTMTKSDFLQQRFVSSEIFVFVDEDYQHDHLKILPASMYVCMYCDNFDKEKDYLKELYDYIQQMNYEVSGDYICEVLSELSMSNKREMFFRLQIPVKFVKK